MKIHTTAHYGRIEVIRILRDKLGLDLLAARRIMEILRDAKDGYELDRVAKHVAEYPNTAFGIIIQAHEALMDYARDHLVAEGFQTQTVTKYVIS